LVTERKDEVFEADIVESKWNAMKEVWQKATEQVCGWTKGPQRHSETWWWNYEVAKAIEEKRCYKIAHKTNKAGCSRSKLCESCKWKSVGRTIPPSKVKEELRKYMENC